MNNNAFDKVSNIELEHVSEDYCKYSLVTEDGEESEVEISGYAQAIINSLGVALLKKSFLEKVKRD